MSKSKCRLIFVFVCKICQFCNHIHQFFLHQLQSLCHNDDIGIVSYIAGSCAKVDDSFRLRTLHTIRVYMGHHIVTYFFLTRFCHIVINIICMRFQLINLLLCNIQTQFLLCLSQSNPQSSPCSEFFVWRENILHLLAGISLR